ncbi:MAG TPA: type ISP restriction/modification enzyme [Thermodesulfobacteriota bacterium]|nr:type ISP restriction/modification enzyme [Thermodesulfobacteriota bacterium]
MLKSYLKNLHEITNRGDAREESYYTALENLLNEYAASIGKKNVHITTLPKKTEAGNPDFRLWDGKQHIFGYIEAKAPTVTYLDQVETTEQLKRYLHTFPNLLLTNFFEFRLYRQGILDKKTFIARPYVMHKLKGVPPVENEEEFLSLLERFFSFSLPKVYDAKTLAIELAKRTRFLKDEVVTQELKSVGQAFLPDSNKYKEVTDRNVCPTGINVMDKDVRPNVLHGFYEAFKKYLISGLTKEDFADLYSQTITYGLFAARTRSENGFNRKLAYDRIPRTIGILRDVFRFISLGDLPQQMEWIVDDISEVLAVTDVKKILHQYFHEGKGKDPIVHFYETFLAQYDPETRERRGVYYTPEAVVSYIVRSLHLILKEKFGKSDGFADNSVTVLDPAAGTLTFLAEAAKLAVEEFVSKYGEGGKENLIKEHILKNYYAFELMMAPYAVGHLKMSFLLEELGYKLQKDDRFKLYLTNTLEMEELAQTELPGMASLSEESHLAGRVKKEQPILVILGNPPYSGHSSNIGEWISDEIKTYYRVDGRPLREKNPKWLQDDYVKFIRFAQWKIDQAGEGILGFITNHSYLDNPTFRGMRQSLMNSFNEIYILDLHGNSLKKEKCPDGSKDENVFDIKQGVAIALFIKNKRRGQTFLPDTCEVGHSELWGLRENKYDWLENNEIKTTRWKSILPKSEFYLFVPRHEGLLESYERNPKITDIFPINSVGIVTSRDSFVIDADKELLKRRIRMFSDKKIPDEIIRQTFNLKDKSNWKLKTARENVRKDENWENSITQILYRPFDTQWIFYHDAVIERSRKEVMRHMLTNNLSICFMRQVSLGEDYSHFLVSEHIVDNRTFLSSKGIIQQAPLYLYPDTGKKDLFNHKQRAGGRKPNINPELFAILSSTYNNGTERNVCIKKDSAGQAFLHDTNKYKEVTDKNVCPTGINVMGKNVRPTDINEAENADDIKITRRHLPHWRLKGATYFITFRTAQGELSVEEQKLVLNHIVDGNEKFYTLIAAIVMPDHVHILLTPREEYDLSRIMKGIKGVSARRINLKRTDKNVYPTKKETSGSIWQDESFDRIIRDQNELNEKLDYMLNNPVKSGLTESPWDYHGWYFNVAGSDLVGQAFLPDQKEVADADVTDRKVVTDKNVCPNIFYYIYAVLYSNIYRTKYAQFLKIDFPRVPFTKDYEVFSRMAELGKRLADLHLLKSEELDPPVARFQGKGDDKVEKIKYEPAGQTFVSDAKESLPRIYINNDQYFEGVRKEVWEYQIGGYQVCEKWLKDRRGRRLSLDDIKHYCRVATAIQKTIDVQEEIDNIYPEVEKEIIEFKKE